MGIILTLHSWWRWVVVVMLVTAVTLLVAWLRPSANTPDRRLMSGFLGALDLQVTLGLILIVGLGLTGGGWPGYRIEHGVTMLLAVFLGHASARWKDAETSIRARNNFFVLLGVLTLVLVGVSRLPQGWLG